MEFLRRLFGQTNKVPDDDVIESAISDEPAMVATNKEEQAAEDTASTIPLADGVTRPLPPDVMLSPHVGHLTFGQSTDVGKVRGNNQDAALSFFFTSHTVEEHPDFGLFIVADGMGGHYDGEKASAITTRVMARHILDTLYLPHLARTADSNSETPALVETLVEAAQKANTEVIKEVPNGGTTLTAAIIMGDLIHIVHIGDSRGYLISKDGIDQLTRDHSLVQRLIELDQLTREEAEEHPQKNVLYRAIGQSETLEVDTLTRRLPVNTQLLLCSDGLWGQIEENQIFETIMNAANPQAACDKLVALANMNGGVDNITAILLKVPGR